MKIAELLKNAGFYALIKENNYIDLAIEEMNNYQLANDNFITFSSRIKHIYFEDTEDYEVVLDHTYNYCTLGIEGLELFGGKLISYLEEIKFIFNAHDLAFDFKDEEEIETKQENKNWLIYHSIVINETKYVVANEVLNRGNGPIVYIDRLEEIINKELKKQGSEKKFYKFVEKDEEYMWFVLLNDIQLKIFLDNPSLSKNRILLNPLKSYTSHSF